MFDEDDYCSDDEGPMTQSVKTVPNLKAMPPEFNHLTSEGENLLKMMKDRGLDLTYNEMRKMNSHSAPKDSSKEKPKAKPRAGYFEGGATATLEHLVTALNKALSKADPHQANSILNYILERHLSEAERAKFGAIKCNIMFGLAAYKKCCATAQSLLEATATNKLAAATFSNYLAKCKLQCYYVLSGYLDLLRAKALLAEHREGLEVEAPPPTTSEETDFADSEVDNLTREIDHTELEYNIKMTKFKNSSNPLWPNFPEFRHRQVEYVSCGDFHTLILVRGPLDKRLDETIPISDLWTTYVFGLGYNSMGQLTGKPSAKIFKEPVLLSGFSGKGIAGIQAAKESSIAYTIAGIVYEWGMKAYRDGKVSQLVDIGEPIKQLEKGYQHYALLTVSGKFYTWGKIEAKGAILYHQAQPVAQPIANVVSFSCGNSCVIAIDKDGYGHSLGNNYHGQLGLPKYFTAPNFRKIINPMLSCLKRVICVGDCSFFVNYDVYVFFCGQYSYSKPSLYKPRQAYFGQEIGDLTSVSGTVGCYYMTDIYGNAYKWEVENSVKFRPDNEQGMPSQRLIACSRGSVFRLGTNIEPILCYIIRKTDEPLSLYDIYYYITLKDYFGLYGNSNFLIPPKFQVFLSTYEGKLEDLLRENKQFIDSADAKPKYYNLPQVSNLLEQRLKAVGRADTTEYKGKALSMEVNEIVYKRLMELTLLRDEQKPFKCQLTLKCETSGKYFLYVFLNYHLLLKEVLLVNMSSGERYLGEKIRTEKLLKDEERRKRAYMERQRQLQYKLKREAEYEDKKKETQRRAEEALKRHLIEQEELKAKAEDYRRARREMMTGGGFDLNKLRPKAMIVSSDLVKSDAKQYLSTRNVSRVDSREAFDKTTESFKSSEALTKTSESFLPDINSRPNSRRKINLLKNAEILKPNEIISSAKGDKMGRVLRESGQAESLSKILNQTKPGGTVLRRGLSKKPRQ